MEAQVLERDTERLQEALDSLPFLEPVVKDTLKEFVLRLKEAEGDNLLRVVLFGSMARGDFDEESDTDVFVLLKEGTDIQLTERVCNIADDAATSISDCYVYISPFIETADSIAEEYKGISRWRFEPVFDAIREEGVTLFDVGAKREEYPYGILAPAACFYN